MKKILSLFILPVLLIVSYSCSRKGLDTPVPGEGLKISLHCSDIASRVTMPGEGYENRIKTVDYFLFNVGAGASDLYVYKGRYTANSDSYCTFYVRSTYVPDADYLLYCVVNYPGDESELGVSGSSADPGISSSDRRTLAQIQAKVLSETEHRTFSKLVSGRVHPADNNDLALVMTGSATFTAKAVDDANLIGTADVSLSRLAAKIDLDFYLDDHVERQKGSVLETWEPLADGNNIRIYLCNATDSVRIGGEPSAYHYFDYAPNTGNTAIAGTSRDEDGEMVTYSTAFSSTAFYSYPQQWDFGDEYEPYIKMVIPWKLTRTYNASTDKEYSTTSQKEFYYKVMLPTKEFASNKWYKLKLYVTQLGSDSDNAVVPVTASYEVADWGGEQNIIITNLVQGLYLDVEEQNQNLAIYSNLVEIPYVASSGGVTIVNPRMSYTNFKTGYVRTLTESGWVYDPSDSGSPETSADITDFIELDENSESVLVHHVMDTDYDGTEYDVSAYTFTFTLHLNAAGDDTSYDKSITVTQYPPLVINQQTSDGAVYVYSETYSSTSGAVIPDNHNSSSLRNYPNYFMGSIVNPTSVNGSGDNNNQHIYEISASVINNTITINGVKHQVYLSDPRIDAGNAMGSGDLSLDGISGYRATSADANNYIAPKLICASSYGKTYAVSYDGAVKRCAAYQEAGYPAGRWRLPTLAEIQFLSGLSENNKIPTLFGTSTTSGYWAAGQMLYLTNGFKDMSGLSPTGGTNAVTYSDGASYSGFVRCVYDTWYWGSSPVSEYDTSNPSWQGFKTTK